MKLYQVGEVAERGNKEKRRAWMGATILLMTRAKSKVTLKAELKSINVTLTPYLHLNAHQVDKKQTIFYAQ